MPTFPPRLPPSSTSGGIGASGTVGVIDVKTRRQTSEIEVVYIRPIWSLAATADALRRNANSGDTSHHRHCDP